MAGAAGPPFNLFQLCRPGRILEFNGVLEYFSYTCLARIFQGRNFKSAPSISRSLSRSARDFPSAEASERRFVRLDVNQRQRQRSIVCGRSPTWSAPDFSDDLSFLVIPSARRISNSTALPMNVVAFWKERRAEKRARRLAKAQSDEIDRQLVEESKHRRQRHDILLISSCSPPFCDSWPPYGLTCIVFDRCSCMPSRSVRHRQAYESRPR
jgi:hypothetical protein